MVPRHRLGRALFAAALSAVVGGSAACTHVTDTSPPPAKSNLVFKRDIYSGKGCLEYSWVSEDKRRLIQLNPSMKAGEGEGPSSKGASSLKVHALTNGPYSLKDWQFPSGPPHPSPIASAVVELKEIEAVATVFYKDRSSTVETKALVPMPVSCPAPAQDVAKADPEITKLDPGTVAKNTAVTITVIGSNFTRDSVILIDGADPTTQYVGPSMLEAALDGADLVMAGKRGVKVHGAKHGRTSNEVMLTVE
jgi:hypothetical protein